MKLKEHTWMNRAFWTAHIISFDESVLMLME